MTSHDAERAYVQSMLDVAEDRFDETIRAMQTDVDRLRDEWAAGYAEQRQTHESRMAAMRDETRAYLRSIAAGDGNERTDVAAGGHEDVASVLTDASAGHNGSRQRPIPDPREAELADRRRAQEMAAAVKAMDLGEYAQLRAELNIGSAGARGLFDS